MAQQVYDPQDEKPVTRPDLQRLEEGSSTGNSGNRQAGNNEESRALGGKNGQSATSTDTAGAADQPADSTPKYEKQVGSGYNPKGTVPGRQGIRDALRFMNNNSRRKKIFYIGGGGFVLLLPIIFFLALLLPSLKIPQLAAEVESYRLARLTRQFYKNASTLTADSNAIDASQDVTVNDLVGKTPFGKAFSTFKPARVINNMKANGVLEYSYKPGPGGTSVLDKINVNLADGSSVTIDPPSFKYKTPSDWLNNYSERIRVAQEVKQAVNQSLDGSNFLVRSGTAEQLRSALGVNLFLWEKAWLSLFGKGTAPDDGVEAQITEKYVAQPDIEGKTDIVQDTAKEAEQANEQCFKSTACAAAAEADGGLSPAAKDVINKFKVQSQSFSNKVNFPYAVMFPVCLAYDASSNVATQFLNSQNMAAIRLFFQAASGSDQIKSGDTNEAAVQALSRQAGDIGDSIPGQIARGEPNVNTEAEISPQGGRVSDYTVFNAFDSWFGGNGSGPETGIANFLANHICGVVTKPSVGIALTITSLLGIFLPGADAAEADAIPAAEAGATEVSTSLASRIVGQLSVRNLYNASKNLAISYETTSQVDRGLTYLGRMLILSQMGTLINGLDQTDFANQVDMGAVAYGNEMMQQGTFGRPLTQSETAGVEKEDVAYMNNQNQSQSSFQRYLALSNPFSPAGRVAIAMESLNLDKVASFFTDFSHMFGTIFTPFNHLLGHASAATYSDADYGMVQFGYSTAEENLIDGDPSYDPLTNDQLINSTTQSDIGSSNNFQLVYGSGGVAETYAMCFGYSYDPSTQTLSYDPSDQIGNLLGGTSPSIKRDSSGNVIADQGTCSPQNLGPNNPKFGDLVLRWRVDEGYQNTLNDLQGVQNVSQ